ncbi:bifunctional diaminohydroxyphosphoribosylaminopyrimidine deaminase/5-amino-6-(5-phosphoribosylamino)uracil reductase RibD [Buchnera aphidicola (Artemisaphis artemisicola)]|uniref:diaminohydroxyphosphoribosylaminopyrimidine deaminase n=1 Tax=Buchnera aphidicola (Artemisaphis artemisicola) TaxID=1241836 RepID=A0A4D6XQY7_9GAMM|nr:bifunctional diaminohydroxyphosphoribosylaminopyrimidine deaminase/5-amino-6-(5-phosphoribosylamino)uracil reductase RibD [Buchnera aphidicola (Artemisaphis artemisicola)]
MKRAIELSKLGEFTTSPNPNVGCVIVKNNNIIGEGWHMKSGDHHAEINALIMAGNKAKGATAYITLEPCNYFGKTPPCCNALVKSGINHVVISNIDPNPKVSGNGILYLKKHGVSVTTGLLSQESIKYNKGFFKRMKTGLP